MYHSLAQRFVLVPLLLGGTSILMTRFSPELWIKTVSEQKVSFTVAVSSQLALISSALANNDLMRMDSLRCIASSSAPMSPEVKAELLENLSCEIHENYGTSEVSFISDLNITIDSHKLRSVGLPIPRVEVRIMKDDGTEAAIGEKGEIQCKTPFLCGGYYKNPEQTEKSIQEGYFRTGDLGFIDDEGYLYYAGRIKDMIVTGAIKVYPVDIEEAVMALGSVKECAAFGLPDERLGEVVAIAVVPEQPGAVSVRELKFHCLENLADYQMPRKYFITESLPKNALGKLVRSELTERFYY
jgi:acyl-CoA synthetase (AMP-forming)/AMP-acid ligase II